MHLTNAKALSVTRGDKGDGPLALPTATERERGKDLISGVDELVKLEIDTLERGDEHFDAPPQSLGPALHAGKIGNEHPQRERTRTPAWGPKPQAHLRCRLG